MSAFDSIAPRPISRRDRNTQRILQAAITILANEGWGLFSLTSVGREAGLSERPVRDRAPSSAALAAQVWQRRLGPELHSSLTTCLAAFEAARHHGSTDELRRAWLAAVERTTQSDAIGEILVIAGYIPEVAAAVDAGLGELIRVTTTPGADVDPTLAARRAFVLAIALGLGLTNRAPGARSEDLAATLDRQARVLLDETYPGIESLPRARADHMDTYPPLAPDDPSLDALLNTALELVALRGVDQVTVREIADAAGFSEGLVFSRYPTKTAMLVDAMRRQLHYGWRVNFVFTQKLEERYGRAIADAIALREATQPGRDVGRGMMLEEMRLAWHDPRTFLQTMDLQEEFRMESQKASPSPSLTSASEFHVSVATETGFVVLCRLNPDITTLPFLVGTRRLADSTTTQISTPST